MASSSKPNAKGKAKAKRKSPLKRYFLLIAAITLFWAAANEPSDLNAATGLIWGLSAVAVLILTCAAVALMEPVFLLILKTWPKPAAAAEAAADAAEPGES